MKRDHRLDSIRGLLLAEITLYHVGAPISFLVFECFGRVSTAAGFVFVAGIVAGAVYGPLAEQGARPIIARSIRRAGYIHGYHVVSFLFLMLLIAAFPWLNDHYKLPFSDPNILSLSNLASVVLLTNQPVFFDILPLYTVFVLAMPLALLGFKHGQAPAVLAVSFLLWCLVQFSWGGMEWFGGSYFDPLAWQMIFVAGLYLGDTQLRRGRVVVAEHWVLLVICTVVAVSGFTLRWDLVDWPALFDQGAPLSNKTAYGALHLVNFFAFSYLVFCLSKRFPNWFVWRPFAFLGRHSIKVFTFHVLAVYLTYPLVDPVRHFASWGHDALALAIVASLWIPAFLSQHLQDTWKKSGRLDQIRPR